MRAVVQRIEHATVTVATKAISKLERGLIAYIGVEVGDGDPDITYIADKVLNLRIFEDAEGKMNRSVLDMNTADTPYGILAISQFTLLGECQTGRRPSFSRAAPPETARPTYQKVVERLKTSGLIVVEGQFQATMHVQYTNLGPVTLLLDSHKTF